MLLEEAENRGSYLKQQTALGLGGSGEGHLEAGGRGEAGGPGRDSRITEWRARGSPARGKRKIQHQNQLGTPSLICQELPLSLKVPLNGPLYVIVIADVS